MSRKIDSITEERKAAIEESRAIIAELENAGADLKEVSSTVCSISQARSVVVF